MSYQPRVWRDKGSNRITVDAGGELRIKSGGLLTNEDGAGAKNGSAVSVVERGIGPVHQTVLTLTALSVTMTDATTNGSHGSHKLYDFPAGLIQILGAIVDLDVVAGSGGISNTAAVVASLGTATVGTGNATLTTTESDIVPSTACTLTDGAGAFTSKSLPTTGRLPDIAALTDSTTGTAGDTLAALPTLTDSPASQDALRDDLNTNVWPVLKNWMASIAAKINGLLSAFRLFDGTGTAKDVYLNLAVPDGDSSASDTLAVTGTITLLWVNHGDV